MAVITMKQLLDAGVHFGHQTRRWNPKMKRFIHGERNGIYIIDLNQTLNLIGDAYTYVRDLTANGGTIMFVGTKRQAQDSIQSYAEKCGMPYVNQRWLGGMLTNFQTIQKRVDKMKEYQRMRDSGEFEAMPKKEALMISRELVKLERNLGGIRGLTKAPNAVFVLDTKLEHTAVTEANKLGLPLVAVVDTNCDPDLVDYVIPGNDDAIRAGELMCRVISDAVLEGHFIRSKKAEMAGIPVPGEDAPAVSAERNTEDQAAHDATQAEAREQAATAAAEREARIASEKDAAEEVAEAPAVEEVAEAPAVEEVAEAPAVEEVAEAPAVEEVAEAPAVEEVADGAHAPMPDGSMPAGFEIKGNADSMKFHQPGGRWYEQTVAEMWFNTPEAASAAGYKEAGKS
ncbi:MAG: small subunit ribosomal protein S2 [Verrucomicrobiales bacterium]|jgi:small subunit ribosomal protein S2